MRDYELSNGNRVIFAPYPNNQTTTGIQSVILKPDEEVEWYTRHDVHGSYVTGYIIRKKESNDKF